MAKLKKIEYLVREVLEINKMARDDDFYLVLNVYGEICPNVRDKDFSYVMANHKQLKLPSFESITRARRKLQAEYPELRGSEEVRGRRSKEEDKFRKYFFNEVPF